MLAGPTGEELCRSALWAKTALRWQLGTTTSASHGFAALASTRPHM